MKWFKPIKTKPKFVNVMSFDEFKQMVKNTDQINIFVYLEGLRLD